MSLCENFSELARELRTAAGTVLSIVGSRLEADARARVDEVGPQWLTEFEEQRDSLDPNECTCQPCPLRDEDVCDEAEAVDESGADNCSDFPCSPGCESWGCESRSLQEWALSKSSAVDTAADPSPADNHHASRGAGDEGRKEDSCIPPPASFRHPIVDEAGGPR